MKKKSLIMLLCAALVLTSVAFGTIAYLTSQDEITNTFTMGEMGKLRDYMENRLRSIEGQICQQSVINAQITANIGCMQGQIATLMGLTKTVIPITSVCPEPMPAYNSWTAPTATT